MNEPQPSDEKPSLSLAKPEQIVEALRGGEVDAIVSETDVLLLRLRQAESALRASQERLHMAEDVADVGVWDWDIGSDAAQCSATYRRIHGFPPGEDPISYHMWLERVHPDDRQRTASEVRRALDGGQPDEFAFRVVRPDGTLRWLAGRWRVVCDEQGQPTRMFGATIDITRYKQVEEAFRQSERFLAVRARIVEVFLSVPNDEMYAEVLGIILEAWESRYGVFGYIDEVGALVCPSMTREVWDTCRIPDKSNVFPREVWGGMWGRALSEKKTLYSNQPLPVPDGHLPLTRAMVVPIVYHEEVIGIIEVANKATQYNDNDKDLLEAIAGVVAPVMHARLQEDRLRRQRRRVEEALKASEAKLRSVTENSADHIMLIDGDGVIRFINHALPGLTVQEVLGKSVFQFMPPEEADRARDCFTRVLETKQPDSFETRYINRKGEERFFESRVRPLQQRGEIVGLTISARDVTEMKRSLKALQSAHARLKAEIEERRRTEQALLRAERLASIGTLAAGIAHEINNPLQAISASAEVVLKSKGRNDRNEILDEFLPTIQTQVQRCAQIVRNMLQFTRQGHSKKWRAELPHAIRRATDMLRNKAEQHRVAIQVKLPENLPKVLMNPVEMEQVFVNLISNAIEASKPGKSVAISATTQEDRLLAKVRDRGCGMTSEQLDHVFDPFFSTRLATGGTGLGLSITHTIVQQHQGNITVDSTPGRGTTFTVSLPVAGDGQPQRESGPHGSSPQIP